MSASAPSTWRWRRRWRMRGRSHLPSPYIARRSRAARPASMQGSTRSSGWFRLAWHRRCRSHRSRVSTIARPRPPPPRSARRASLCSRLQLLMRTLAAVLEASTRQVTVWFQNRRARGIPLPVPRATPTGF
mmetsp:Transcript_35385/g.104922  ORF Transcript_35385/g.104922 Transcript_35385/m.104922 type:complete len:131 (+) Transcript_35385:511-903(+)